MNMMNTRNTRNRDNINDNNDSDKPIIPCDVIDIDIEFELELMDSELEFMDMIKQLKPWKACTELTRQSGQWAIL